FCSTFTFRQIGLDSSTAANEAHLSLVEGRGLSALASQGAERPRRVSRKGEGDTAGHWPNRSAKPAASASPRPVPSRAQPASAGKSDNPKRCHPHPLSLSSPSARQGKEPSPVKKG